MIKYYQNIDFKKYDKSSTFFKELEQLFKSNDVYPPEANGPIECTLSLSSDCNIKNISTFNNFISDVIEPTLNEKIIIARAWANKMFFGSSGKIHIHNYRLLNKVIVFYYCAEEDSGKFIIPAVEEFAVKTGDMIVHVPQLPHMVSVHNSHIPRISIIIETLFEK
jgi:hypothetical protein